MRNNYGKMSFRVLTRVVKVSCVRCLKVYTADPKWQAPENYLRDRGWVKESDRWVCQNCRNRMAPKPIYGFPDDRGLGLLLRLWLARGDWDVREFAQAMGISRARVFELRDHLQRKGFVDPLDKRKLTIKRREAQDESERATAPVLRDLQALGERRAPAEESSDASGTMHSGRLSGD